MPLERALGILREEAARGLLDSELVELFIAQGIYKATIEAEEMPDTGQLVEAQISPVLPSQP
jgi:hypothetical protein